MARWVRWFVAYATLAMACGAEAPDDVPTVTVPQDLRGVCEVGPVARQLAPLSTATTTSQRPTVRWRRPPGTFLSIVELCRDDACRRPEQAIVTAGERARPLRAISAGAHFWRVFSFRIGRGPCLVSVSRTWEFFVRHRAAPVDTSWGTVPDFNRDGLPDLAVGAPNAGPGGDEPEGRVYVFHGTPAGFGATPDVTLSLPGADTRFAGSAIAAAGDVNGDGYGDLVVGDRVADDDDGRAWVYHGGPAGLSAAPATTIPGPESGFLGGSVAGLGDVNGDGYGDIAIDASGYANAAGAVQVHLGSAAGVGASADRFLLPPPGGAGAFGDVVRAAGDVNGDGFADLMVGASEAVTDARRTGRAFVYMGSLAGLAATPSTTILAPSPSSVRFGDDAAGVGDLDGDGYADLVFSQPILRGDNGLVFVYRGSAAGVGTTPSATIESPVTPEALFGRTIAGAGDVNGDGYDDLALTSSPTNSGGMVHLFHGGPGGVGAAPNVTLPSPAGLTGGFGNSLAGLGDLDRDGDDDLMVGAPSVGAFDGRVYRFDGSASGLGLAPTEVLAGPDGGLFGSALAGRY